MTVTGSEQKTLYDINPTDIVETIPSSLLVLDKNLNITSANRAFYQTFQTSPAETVGCHIYDLGSRQWDIPALRSLLESVIPHRTTVEGFEVEHDFPSIGRRTMLVNARKLFRQGGVILLAIEDVSEERAATQASERNRLLTESIVDTIRDPLVVLEKDMTIVTASAAFLQMFKITQAELQGRPLSQLGQHQWDVPMRPALRNLLLRYVQCIFSQITNSVVCNSQHSLHRRLARWIALAMDCVELDTLPLTHELLAIMLGVRRSGVTEGIAVLKKAGVIAPYKGGLRVIDHGGLHSAACVCYGTVRIEYRRLLGPLIFAVKSGAADR